MPFLKSPMSDVRAHICERTRAESRRYISSKFDMVYYSSEGQLVLKVIILMAKKAYNFFINFEGKIENVWDNKSL